jgi:transglutaminase-like putative cysteine protease
MKRWDGLVWAAAAFVGGVLLNIDRVPVWVPVAALLCIAWRLLARTRPGKLPGTFIRSTLALVLVVAVLGRFRTLNGLSAGTALLVLMGAIKLLETRTQRDQFIVIGAALFLLLAACLDRQNLLRVPLYVLQAWLCCAALAAIAYLPGVASSTRTGTFDNRAAITVAGRNLLYALPLALCLFFFFPRVPGAFWSIPRSDEAITGLSDTMSPGSIAELTASYEIAFRATFDGVPPPPQERYWRGPVLHDFDGYTWRRSGSRFDAQQPLEYLGPAYRYRVSLEPSSQRWWYSLDTPTGTPDAKVFFTYDYQLVSAEPVTQPVIYTAVSHTSTRATGELSPSMRRQDTSLPPARNPRSRALALQLHRQSASDAAFVLKAIEYLRTGGFEYSLTPARLSLDSVDDFLFNTRSGFCGHFASAFVSLMRAAGVPARVVTGYLGGEWNPTGGYFTVRQSDAHSWAEVWLDARGWTRVDPTAVVEPGRLRRGILDLLPNAVSAPARFVWSTPWLISVLQHWDAINAWWNDRVVKFNYEDQLHFLERLGFDSPGVQELGWAFALELVAWLLWTAWQIGRGRPARHPDRLARAYTRLGRKITRAGITRKPHQGPLAFADEISLRRPELAAVARALILAYAQLRYGPPANQSLDADIAVFERRVARLRVRKTR